MKTLNLQTAWGLVMGLALGCTPAPTLPIQNESTPVPVSKDVPQSSPPIKITASETTAVAAVTTSDEPLEPIIAPEDSPSAPEDIADSDFTLEDGFTLLSLEDFETFAAEFETWTAAADLITCTGKPKGYLYSRAAHRNFTWRLEYRFVRPKSLKDDTKFKGNTGFLVYINGEHKLWPLCIEIQGKHEQMAAIKENGGAAPVVVQEDKDAREASRLPVGQWNRLEITSKDGALTAKLNDIVITRSEPNFLSEGQIGIQAEDHPFAVRRMRIRDE